MEPCGSAVRVLTSNNGCWIVFSLLVVILLVIVGVLIVLVFIVGVLVFIICVFVVGVLLLIVGVFVLIVDGCLHFLLFLLIVTVAVAVFIGLALFDFFFCDASVRREEHFVAGAVLGALDLVTGQGLF